MTTAKNPESGSNNMSDSEKSVARGGDQVNGSEQPDMSNKAMAGDGAKSILVKHEAPLGWLIVNRPQVKNALNFEAWRGIVAAMEELNADPEVRVIIMRGIT